MPVLADARLVHAVALLPACDRRLSELLRLPIDEVASLRSDPASAGILLRHRIAIALRACASGEAIPIEVLSLADQVEADAYSASEDAMGRLLQECLDAGAGPEEVQRRMMEFFVREVGPEVIEYNCLGESA